MYTKSPGEIQQKLLKSSTIEFVIAGVTPQVMGNTQKNIQIIT